VKIDYESPKPEPRQSPLRLLTYITILATAVACICAGGVIYRVMRVVLPFSGRSQWPIVMGVAGWFSAFFGGVFSIGATDTAVRWERIVTRICGWVCWAVVLGAIVWFFFP